MASAKLLIGGAGAAALTVRVTRSLYARWNVLPAAERARIEPVAERAKQSALDLRGASTASAPERRPARGGAALAAALLEAAAVDPELDEGEVVAAARGPGARARPAGRRRH